MEHRSTDSLEVVIVTYRSRPHIEALRAAWGSELAVAVVDNSADCDGVRAVVESTPNWRYVEGGGQGYARAANLGAFTSTARHVGFVNPDSRPAVADLRQLSSRLAADPSAISYAATMLDRHGDTEIGTAGWEPTVIRSLIYACGLHKPWHARGLYAKPARGERCAVDWTSGACLVLDMAKFREVGGYDEMFFVYSEDMSLGRTARAHGYRQVLVPDLRIAHADGNSGAPSAEMARLRGASFTGYLRTYHHPVQAAAVVGVTAAGTVARLAKALVDDRPRARSYAAFLTGMLTRTATVGGVEVARSRRREVLERRRLGVETPYVVPAKRPLRKAAW